MSNETTRLNKFISDTGICSRREADKLIEAGKVLFNGQVATLGMRVTDSDKVFVNGKELNAKQNDVFIAFNKPVGITCTTDLKDKKNIIEFINHPKRIFPIGRLDNPSEGLIFLTNNGDIVNKILRAGNNHEKEYLVKVDKPIKQEFIEQLRNGIPILETVTKKCSVEKVGSYEFKIILTQGLNRQIRRMCDYLDYQVKALKRIRIMHIELGNLPVGEWRDLSKEELIQINNLVVDSIKTEEASKFDE